MSEAAPQPNLSTDANPTGSPPQSLPQFFGVKLHFQDADGFIGEIFVSENSRPLAWIATTIAGLKKAHLKPFNPHEAPSITLPAVAEASPRGRAPRERKAGAAYAGEVYTECPDCGADVYDNRTKKQRDSWKGPYFKCKNECGFVVFKPDGTPND